MIKHIHMEVEYWLLFKPEAGQSHSLHCGTSGIKWCEGFVFEAVSVGAVPTLETAPCSELMEVMGEGEGDTLLGITERLDKYAVTPRASPDILGFPTFGDREGAGSV